MKKTFTVADVLNIVAFYNHINAPENSAKADEIGTKVRWALKKAVATMTNDAKQFEEFRDSEVQKIRDEFFSEEKSKEVAKPKLDNDGNPELDENGNQITETSREVNDEYKDAYKSAIDELNKSLNEIAAETHEYEYKGADIDALVESLSNDSALKFEDLNVLDAVLSE